MRALIEIIIFVLIGAVLAYAVAFAATLSARSWKTSSALGPTLDEVDRRWLEGRPLASNQVWNTQHRSAFGWDDRLYYPFSTPWVPVSPATVRTRAGWPMRIVQSETVPGPPPPFGREFRGGIRLKWQLTGPPIWATSLPLKPLWTGLIVNAVLYGAVAWVLVRLLPGRLRRRVRVWRRQCPSCGYPRGGVMCPECGEGFGEGSRAAH